MWREKLVAFAAAVLLLAASGGSAQRSPCGEAIATLSEDDVRVCKLNRPQYACDTDAEQRRYAVTECGLNAAWVLRVLTGLTNADLQARVAALASGGPTAARDALAVLTGGPDGDAVFKVQWTTPAHIFVVERLGAPGAYRFYLYQSNVKTFSLNEWMHLDRAAAVGINTDWNAPLVGGNGIDQAGLTAYWQHLVEMWALFTDDEHAVIRRPVDLPAADAARAQKLAGLGRRNANMAPTYTFVPTAAMTDFEQRLWGSVGLTSGKSAVESRTLGKRIGKKLVVYMLPHVTAAQCNANAAALNN